MERWIEPTVEWRSGTDCEVQRHWLVEHGTLLITWPAAPGEQTVTDCFQVGDDYWIWQLGVGGVRFRSDRPHVVAYPSPQGDSRWFQQVVSRSWLPAVYPFWGRQVLHATAVASLVTGGVLGFVGPSLAGKSTIAYGLGRRAGWTLVCDDTLVFSSADGALTLHRVENEARLRPASAAYYGTSGLEYEPVTWPACPLHLTALYVLQGEAGHEGSARIARLPASESYPLLLAQAHALTLNLPFYTRRLMCDYLDLAKATPVFRLAYLKSFDALEATLDAVEDHGRRLDVPA